MFSSWISLAILTGSSVHGSSYSNSCTSSSDQFLPTNGILRASGFLSGIGILQQAPQSVSVLPGRCAHHQSTVWQFLPPSALEDCYPDPYSYCPINETVQAEASEFIQARFPPTNRQTVPRWFQLKNQSTVYGFLIVEQSKLEYSHLRSSYQNRDATENALLRILDSAKHHQFHWLPVDSLKLAVSDCLRRRFHHKADSNFDYQKNTGVATVDKYSVDCKTVRTREAGAGDSSPVRYLRISLIAHYSRYRAPEKLVRYKRQFWCRLVRCLYQKRTKKPTQSPQPLTKEGLIRFTTTTASPGDE